MNNTTLENLINLYPEKKEHSKQVKEYAEKLFDAINGTLTNFSEKEKQYLITAALLHDIGYARNKKSHHKHTLDIILESNIEGFNEYEKQIIAHTARYHRSSLPDETKHSKFASLTEEQKEIIKKLGSILKIADGLDKPSKNLILRMRIETTETEVHLYLKSIGFKPILKTVETKKDLFEQTFKKNLAFLIE